MSFTDFQSFIFELEKQGELIRVTEPVDPELEVTEIAIRAVKQGSPAIVFENVIGSNVPLVINSMASMKRLEIAIGRPPEELGEEILSFVQDINPPKISSFWRNKKTLWRLLKIRPKKVRGAIVQQEENKRKVSEAETEAMAATLKYEAELEAQKADARNLLSEKNDIFELSFKVNI